MSSIAESSQAKQDDRQREKIRAALSNNQPKDDFEEGVHGLRVLLRRWGVTEITAGPKYEEIVHDVLKHLLTEGAPLYKRGLNAFSGNSMRRLRSKRSPVELEWLNAERERVLSMVTVTGSSSSSTQAPNGEVSQSPRSRNSAAQVHFAQLEAAHDNQRTARTDDVVPAREAPTPFVPQEPIPSTLGGSRKDSLSMEGPEDHAVNYSICLRCKAQWVEEGNRRPSVDHFPVIRIGLGGAQDAAPVGSVLAYRQGLYAGRLSTRTYLCALLAGILALGFVFSPLFK